MAKVKVKVEDEKAWEGVGEDSGEFELLPKGYYVFAVKECNPGYAKAKEGEGDDKSKPRLEWVTEAVATWSKGTEGALPPGNFGNFWEYMSFSKESAWKRAEIGYALGLCEKGQPEYEIDTDEVPGLRFVARVKHEKDKMASEEQGQTVMRARQAKWLPFSDADADAAFGAGDGSETNVDFGGEEEANPFGETAAEEEATEYYTREGLEAIESPKDLGDIAREFDIDPATLLVKGKGGKVDLAATKEAIVSAILEAQGVGDNGGEEPEAEAAADEESPF